MSEFMPSNATRYVVYYVSQRQSNRERSFEPRNTHALLAVSEAEESIQAQQLVVKDFLDKADRELGTSVVESYIEVLESRKTNKWPQLTHALEACHKHNATLLIAELGLLASNDSFSQQLLSSGTKFYCCDQPFITQPILEALSKHALVQKKLHGKLIRKGLKLTSAKSGNPNAAEVISKVNKPKIDTAIIFAFLLQSIINDYKRKGYSQRLMVKTLNEENFTAPEGGKWVLSQLQKVLDRVRLNELALEHGSLLGELQAEGLNFLAISEALNQKTIPSIKRTTWDELQVKKLAERIEQIKEITLINQFVLALISVVHVYKEKNLSIQAMLTDLNEAGLPLRMGVDVVTQGVSTLSRSNPHLQQCVIALKDAILSFPEPANTLEVGFESAAKHIPAYVKIIKGHIDQLAEVLELENHNRRGIDNAQLAEPVKQLIEIFNCLEEDDKEIIENLSFSIKNWHQQDVQSQTVTNLETNKAELAYRDF